MAKQNIGTQAFTLPMCQAILGTHVDGRPNYMALAWLTRVNYQPPLLGIGVNKNNRSAAAILEHREFAVSIPGRNLLAATDYVGLVSAKRTDKSGVFTSFYGELDGAPMVAEAPLAMECRLHQAVELPTNWLFIGEIVGAWCEADCLSDGAPDPARINPFMLTMPDNHFWSLGEAVGKAWSDGKALKSGR